MDRRSRLILKEMHPNDNVLDVGCVNEPMGPMGEEQDHDWLHRLLCLKAKHVKGTDLLESEVMRLQQMDYDVVVADAETMRLDERFDVIVAGELIEHLANPGMFLDRARDHLKSDGKLILTTPNVWRIINFVGVAIKKLPLHRQHTCFYDRKTLTQLLERHAFRIEKFEFVTVSPRRRFTVFLSSVAGNLLYRLGFKEFGAAGLFLVASLK